MSLFDSSQSLHFFLINDRERTRNSLHSVIFFSIKKRTEKKAGIENGYINGHLHSPANDRRLFTFFFLLCNYSLSHFYLSSLMIEYNMQKCISITRYLWKLTSPIKQSVYYVCICVCVSHGRTVYLYWSFSSLSFEYKKKKVNYRYLIYINEQIIKSLRMFNWSINETIYMADEQIRSCY
jgi:hypothetical protein